MFLRDGRITYSLKKKYMCVCNGQGGYDLKQGSIPGLARGEVPLTILSASTACSCASRAITLSCATAVSNFSRACASRRAAACCSCVECSALSCCSCAECASAAAACSSTFPSSSDAAVGAGGAPSQRAGADGESLWRSLWSSRDC